MADTEAFAHRAIVDAVVAGLMKPRRGLRVASASADESVDVLVMTDGGGAADADLAAVMARARASVGDTGIVALMVGSRVTRELVEVARASNGSATASSAPRDAYARAIEWARARSDAPSAPDVTPERLAALVEAAAASGLALVEPETAVLSPALARVRNMRSPRARALLATVALGASARPMLFVPAGRAPKGGLARWKADRIADGWVAAAPPRDGDSSALGSEDRDLLQTALAILHDAARDRRPALPFTELLREARERWSLGARARGARASASSTDIAELATFLVRRAVEESVLLYALDPADPGWTLIALGR